MGSNPSATRSEEEKKSQDDPLTPYPPIGPEDAFIQAAKEGVLSRVQQLLDKDDKLLYYADLKGYTALHWSADRGHVEVVDFLLSSKADVHCKAGIDGRTALHDAAEFGREAICTTLLNHKADPDVPDRLYGWTPLHFASQNGHVGVCRQIVQCQVDLNCDSPSGTALHAAAQFGREDVVRVLLDAGADRNVGRGTHGTPYDVAVRSGHHQLALLLGEIDPQEAALRMKRLDALIKAAQEGDLEVVKEQLEADPSLLDERRQEDGYCALHWAADKGHFPVCVYLLEHKADVNQRGAKDHRTSMHDAAEFGRVEVCELLLQYKADALVLDSSYAWTPLHFASQNGHTGICELIAPHTNVNICGRFGSPLEAACQHNHADVVKCLLRSGADRTLSVNGHSVRDVAAANNHHGILAVLDETLPSEAELRTRRLHQLIEHSKAGALEEVKAMISREPALINMAGSDGYSALHWAADKGQMAVCEHLLESKADVNCRGQQDGRTPLHDSAEYGRLRVCELLLRHGADASVAESRYQAMPLHFAAQNGHLGVCEQLCQALRRSPMADIDQSSRDVGSALMIACRKGHKDVVELLVLHGADPRRPSSRGAPIARALAMGRQDITEVLRTALADQALGVALMDSSSELVPSHDLFGLRAFLPIVQLVALYCTALPLPPIRKAAPRLPITPPAVTADSTERNPPPSAARK